MTFPIDFVRQVIEQTLLEEHIKNNRFFGGENQVNLFSFYEQLEKEDEVNRYVEKYRDLTDQQNRTGLIMNGTIIAPENPTITNVYSAFIVPFTFTCSFRVTLANRDMAIETINNLIDKLKGKVTQVVEFKDGKLFKVGTMGTGGGLESVKIMTGDFIASNVALNSLDTTLSNKMSQLESLGFSREQTHYRDYFYYYIADSNNKLKAVYKPSDNSAWQVVSSNDGHEDFVLPNSTSTIANRMNLDLSFDSFRCDEPRVLNATEYCVISFGGSATLASKNVFLGNQIVKIGVQKTKIKADTDISISNTFDLLEPLEIPSGGNAGTQLNQLLSNKFVPNTHSSSLSPSIQYTFILDRDIPILMQWFKYARYGIVADGNNISWMNGVSPNMIYTIEEIIVNWEEATKNSFKAKIIESIDIETTESDVTTITVPFQVQGDNT